MAIDMRKFKKKERTVPTRVPKKMVDELDTALGRRFQNKLIQRKDLKITEGLRLMSKTQGWKNGLKDIERLPRREDIK